MHNLQFYKPYYLVLDFEANCSKQFCKDHEIIEFPAVLVNSKNGKIISEFRYFIKTASGRRLSDFIKDLTHITDEQVENGFTFSDSLIKFEQWCKEHDITWKSTTIITVGNWDLETMLHNQLNMEKLKLNKFLNDLFGSWVNIKVKFRECMGIKSMGMAGMLEYMGLELTGHHHSGIDDCRNTVKICNKLIDMNCDVTELTNYRNVKFWYHEHKLPYKLNSKNEMVKC